MPRVPPAGQDVLHRIWTARAGVEEAGAAFFLYVLGSPCPDRCFSQAGELEVERARLGRLRREWGQPKPDERLDQRREDVRNEARHLEKEWLTLIGERLELLAHDPVDAAEFHATLTGLLMEKIRLLECLKLGLDSRT